MLLIIAAEPELVEKSLNLTKEKLPNQKAEDTFEWKVPALNITNVTNVTNDLKVNSFHIKEERQSMPNKTGKFVHC